MPSIKLQKDKLVTEIFTAVLQKDKSNPVLYDPIFDLPLNSLKKGLSCFLYSKIRQQMQIAFKE